MMVDGWGLVYRAPEVESCCSSLDDHCQQSFPGTTKIGKKGLQVFIER